MVTTYEVFLGLLIVAFGFLIFPLLKSRTRNEMVIFVISLIALPTFSVWMYQQLGSPGFNKPIKETKIQNFNPKEVLTKLKLHLEEHPSDAKGWYLLGRIYYTSQDFENAVKVFEKAYQLEASNQEYQIQYALALYAKQGRNLTGKPRELLTNVLAKDPNNPQIHALFGWDAYWHQHYSEAIHEWQRLITQLPKNSPDEKMILSAIAIAKKEGHI